MKIIPTYQGMTSAKEDETINEMYHLLEKIEDLIQEKDDALYQVAISTRETLDELIEYIENFERY